LINESQLSQGDATALNQYHIFLSNVDLVGRTIRLRPLKPDDCEAPYRAASDPKIWELHPDSERGLLPNNDRQQDAEDVTHPNFY
jgi:hypothetical protein